MKISVLGAGVIGVSTAYALARLGHEVVVFDKAGDVASGTSHANGAQLSYSYVDPLASPAMLRQLPRLIAGLDPAIKLGLTWKLAYYAWGLKFLSNCTHKNARKNLAYMLSLARQSSNVLQTIQDENKNPSLSPSSLGKLILANSDHDINKFKATERIKSEYGTAGQFLDKKQVLEIEPAMAYWQDKFVGGLFSSTDIAMDPVRYCTALKNISEQQYGVNYRFNQEIKNLVIKDQTLQAIQTEQQDYTSDETILCLGHEANTLLAGHGLKQPIYPMRGYSLTLPEGKYKLNTSVTAPADRLVFTKLDKQIRIAGFMDANIPVNKIQERQKHLKETAERLWPDIADYMSTPRVWSGLRPMTPSGRPIVKRSPVKHLYYNLGHGSLGFTLAAACADQIASMIGPTQERVHSVGVLSYA